MTGTRSGGNSTPRSPRATITPSRRGDDALEVLDRVGRLDLRDDRRGLPPRLADLAHELQVLGASHEARARCSRRRARGRTDRSSLSFSVSALMRIVLLGRCTPMWLRMPPPWSTVTFTRSPSTPTTREDDAPVVEEDRSPTRTSPREALVVDGDARSSPSCSPSTRDDLSARRQVELAGKCAGADLRAAEVLQRRDRLPLGVARLAQPREARAVLLVGAVREVEARDVHAGVDERFEARRRSRTRGRACRRAWRDVWPCGRAACHLAPALCTRSRAPRTLALASRAMSIRRSTRTGVL